MNRWTAPAATALLWAAAAWAAEPGTLTTLSAVHALSNAEASGAIPVAFEATVGYSRPYENLLFVQDGGVAIFVRPPTADQFTPGDRVLVKGKTQRSFRPLVVGSTVTLIRHGEAPKPLPATFDELIRAQHDSLLVSVQATVRAADVVVSAGTPVRSARLQLLTEGGHFEANVDTGDETALKSLLDAEVEITGAAAGKFDNKMQQTGVVLYVSGLNGIRIVKRAGASPWTLPITPMDEVLAGYHMRDLTPRVRVHGTITYYQPGSAIVLQDSAKSLWIATHTREPLQIGDLADATGFPDAHDRLLTLTDGEIQDSHIQAPITPQPATWRQLAFWSSNTPVGHQNDLVSIEGQVVAEVQEASQDEYVLSSDGRLFTAIYRPQPTSGGLGPATQIAQGSRVRVTGICVIADANSIIPGQEVPFNILMRTLDDIAVVKNPSLLSVPNLILLVGLLLVVLAAAGAMSWTLSRKVRRQTAAMAKRVEAEAAMERKRSRILEDINGSRPLAEILEQITEMVSFSLQGAPCWCEVTDGARLGNYPPDAQKLRIASEEIPSRLGPPLGALFAGLDPKKPPAADETETLSLGARLATLAIETRRLYADLRRRSEFDLLTDVHNRFSLDKELDAIIEHARENAGIFGLIYIDLDEFKQVNDIYGHRIGDLYLQEVAQRMKRQLRAGDMLARLGGDEFAALIAVVPTRVGVEEIAQRLVHSLSQPFSVEGYVLESSASVGIALYPEDGTTKDSLLSAADAAMYVAKHTRGQNAESPAERRDPGSPL